jgi:hypothetical protein
MLVLSWMSKAMRTFKAGAGTVPGTGRTLKPGTGRAATKVQSRSGFEWRRVLLSEQLEQLLALLVARESLALQLRLHLSLTLL